MKYQPEGSLLDMPENLAAQSSLSTLRSAMERESLLEGRALVCDSGHNLLVDLNGIRGIIPREECAIGISDGSVRDIAILSRVNKPVCFVVTGIGIDRYGEPEVRLSRRLAQENCRGEYIEKLRPGDILPARVTHLEQFGAFVDIGCGIVSLIPIDAISVSRISHPKDRFFVGEEIYAVVRSMENGRITLSHRELLGTWEENAIAFAPGETVAGVVRSVEDYGIFVELTPNLAGLAEKKEGVRPGQQASVFIKSLLPEKMKVKLILIDAFDGEPYLPKLTYFKKSGHMDRWVYSTPSCSRVIETVFD